MPKNAKVAPVEEEVEGAAHDTTEEDAAAGAMFENDEDGLVVNLSEVEEQKFELIPNGKQNIIIEENAYSLSKSSGKPMWSLKLNITGGEFKGRKLFPILSFSEKALPGTKAVIAVIAPELLDAPFKVNDPNIVTSVVGRFAKVQVGTQKAEAGSGYDDQNRVKRWFQPDGDSAFMVG